MKEIKNNVNEDLETPLNNQKDTVEIIRKGAIKLHSLIVKSKINKLSIVLTKGLKDLEDYLLSDAKEKVDELSKIECIKEGRAKGMIDAHIVEYLREQIREYESEEKKW